MVALKGGVTTEIENVLFADGEVMDFIATGVRRDIWLAANICSGEVDRSDMMVCDGSQSTEVTRVSLQEECSAGAELPWPICGAARTLS